MRNEAGYAEGCLRSLLRQTLPLDSYEILVVDGRSSDGSQQIVNGFQEKFKNVRLLDNPAQIVPSAMNIGIRNSRGEFIVRADVHSTYPPHYIATAIALLQTTGADNVGGPAITTPANRGLAARIVASLLSSRFGVGNSAFRTSLRPGYVDTVPFGAFRKQLFRRIGLFQEALGRNEDNELNARIRNAGGTVYLSPLLAFRYFPAASLRQHLRNTYRSAKWHLYTLRKHPGAMGLRHLIPAAFTGTVLLLLALTPLAHVFLFALAALLALYFLAACVYSWRDCKAEPVSYRIVMPFAFLMFHLTYGWATLAGLTLLLRTPRPQPTR
jgi:glycosyltransferase involved in cell wall biosynthesis